MQALQVGYSVLTPLLAAVVGGLLVHFAARRRDVENDRRRQRIDYLISAYRVLARSAHRDLQGERAEVFEDALADIVLLGTAEQIGLARQAMQSLAGEHDAPIDPLLVTLRRELRGQLDLVGDDLATVPVVRMSWGTVPGPPPVRVGEPFEVRFDATVARTRETLYLAPRPVSAPTNSGQIAELHTLAATAPGAAVMEAYGLLRRALVAVLEVQDEGLDAVQLASSGMDRGLVAPATLQSVEGLHVLMQLSHSGGAGAGLTVERAHEYVDLVGATMYALTNYDGRG